MSTVLFEIGTEEMPASYQPSALAQLAELARARLAEERIDVGKISCWGTPRRLTLYLDDVAARQAPAVRQVRGPVVSTAFAADGEPTQAAIGFARSHGIPVNELHVQEIDGQEYVLAVFQNDGRPTTELLPAIFSHLFSSLSFPRTMRWGSSPLRFARPVRWIVAMLDDQVIPCAFGDVTAGRLTRGHRFLAPGEVAIPSAADYRRVMEENHVLVVPEERRETIRLQLEAIAQQDGAVILDDGTLLDETTFRLEYPTAVRCPFDNRFLSLPHEVLQQVLSSEQQFFLLATPAGGLLPAFIGVRNGDRAYLSSVREGYEAVARAKLLDALFFFEQDGARALADRVEELRGVIFQERLGTFYDKAMRLQALAESIAGWLELPAQYTALAARAALLCKADRLTALATEHSQLQGILGGVYARLSGEPEAVATAIGEHVRPRTAADAIPASALGRVVALADKADTVAACFAIGLFPNGKEDPFALERETQGLVRTLAEGGLRLSLDRLLSAALAQLRIEPGEETLATLQRFMRGQVEACLLAAEIPPAIVKAVMAISADLPADALARAQTIRRQVDDPAFPAIVRVAARLASMSRQATEDALREELLTEPAERELLLRYQEIVPRAEFFAARGEFAALPELLATLAPAVARFFAEVMVMVEQPDLRAARLTLVSRLSALFRLLGDLAALS